MIQFYDTHLINEDEILAKLAARGTHLDTLTEDELKDFDQDHYGGVQVVDVLAGKAGIRREHHVLDVRSGMGGPARWIAQRCRVERMDDLSEDWKRILVDRLAMYRSLCDTTVAKFGEARFLEYDRVYSHFVGLFVAQAWRRAHRGAAWGTMKYLISFPSKAMVVPDGEWERWSAIRTP